MDSGRTDTLYGRATTLYQRMLANFGDNHPEKERIVLLQGIIKINKKGKEQNRILLITDKALYNIKKNTTRSCQRRIDFDIIESISTSLVSNEFTIHIPTEYDYRYKSLSSSDKEAIIALLSKRCNIRINRMHVANMMSITCTKHQAKALSIGERRQKLKSYEGRLSDKYIFRNITPNQTLHPSHPAISKHSNWYYDTKRIAQHLKYVNHKEKLLVYGYIRKKALNKYRLNIAIAVMDYCLLFAFVSLETFDSVSANKSFQMSDDHKTISFQTNDSYPAYKTVYGTHVIPCNEIALSSSRRTFIWKFRINRIDRNGIVFVGIHNKIKTETSFVHCARSVSYAAGGSHSMCNIWRCGQNIGHMLRRFEKGDWIELVLDLVENRIIFIVNSDTKHVVTNLITLDQKYRLAVVLSNACVSLKDFVIYNGSFKRFQSKHKRKLKFTTRYFR